MKTLFPLQKEKHERNFFVATVFGRVEKTMSEFLQNFYDQPKTDRRFAATNGREKKTWEVSQVWDRHHEIKRRIFLGQKNTVIAQALGISEVSVSQVRNSEIIQRQLKAMQIKADESCVDVRSEIRKLAPKAIEAMKGVLESETARDSDKIRVAMDILDRDGHAPTQKVEHLHGHFTAQDLMEIKERAARLAKSNGALAVEDASASTPSENYVNSSDIIELSLAES